MLADILNAANLYADGVKHVQERRDQWIKKHTELKEHLKEVAEYLNTNAAYKQGFFVDTLHAFDENINGTSASMPSITLRSGPMSMLVTFKNNMGEKKEFTEDGFHITLTPTITGQVIAFLIPHQSELNKTPPQYITLAVIDEPGKLTMEVADTIIVKGMQIAFFSSFTGMGEQQQPPEAGADASPLAAPHSRNPIGFKLHETTEEVK